MLFYHYIFFLQIISDYFPHLYQGAKSSRTGFPRPDAPISTWMTFQYVLERGAYKTTQGRGNLVVEDFNPKQFKNG